ncbi:MAG: hypothetical protein NTZ86_09570, partial [Legionellales bacterium]|nr:hypothetical protein [Legionellales bacterium]
SNGDHLAQSVQHRITEADHGLVDEADNIAEASVNLHTEGAQTIARTKNKATNGVIPGHAVDRSLDFLHLKKAAEE